MKIENALVKRYFEAWHQHDTDAILATLAEGGSYADPATQGELRGRAIADYAQSLFTAFPDMSLELISDAAADNGVIAAPWILRGTHDGVLMGQAPTGKSVVLHGCDFMKIKGGLLVSVVGVWDINELYTQLGLSA